MPRTLEREKQKQVPPVGRNDKEKQVPHRPSPVRNDKETRGLNDRETFHSNAKAQLWARVSAIVGAAVWAGIAVLARVGIARVGAIELLFLFAPLVIVPLGLELGRGMGACGRLDEIGRRFQPLGAGLAVVAMLLPPGGPRALLLRDGASFVSLWLGPECST
jgi:hypothetical protein